MRKKTGSDSSPAYVYYFYDAAGNVIVEKDGSGATLAEYLRFDGQLIGQYKSSTTYFFHQDHLGSTRIVTNVSGGISDTYDNRPFGDNVSGGSLTSLKFTGLEKDSATGEAGLNHTWFRKHSAEIGRWLSPDQLPGELTNPQSLNRYAYVLNSALNLVDPLGLTVCVIDGIRSDCGFLAGRADISDVFANCPSEDVCRNTRYYLGGEIYRWQPVGKTRHDEAHYNSSLSTDICDVSIKSKITGYIYGWKRINADDVNQAQLRALASEVVKGAGVIGDPKYIIGFYVASAAAGAAGFVVYDISLVQEGFLFGTRFGGNTPLLNSNNTLRIGWSYIRSSGEYVFRIGGDALKSMKNPHINLWPPRWWGGPPGP